MPAYPSTRHEAIQRPHTHTFVPKRGYIEIHGKAAALTPGRNPVSGCRPPRDTKEWSWHNLKGPGSDKTVAFQWQLAREVWVRLDPNAKRLGFPADYLSSHGWSYAGPAKNRHG